jgi:hypothetical protein
MALKNVNSTLTVMRDGVADVIPLKNMPYAQFVALQSALAAALSSLCSLGVARVADAVAPTGRKVPPMGGDVDVSFSLVTDHGAGSSEFAVAYRGLSPEMADMTVGIFKQASNSILG